MKERIRRRRALALPVLLLCTLVLVRRLLGGVISSTRLSDGVAAVGKGGRNDTHVVDSSLIDIGDDRGNRTTAYQADDGLPQTAADTSWTNSSAQGNHTQATTPYNLRGATSSSLPSLQHTSSSNATGGTMYTYRLRGATTPTNSLVSNSSSSLLGHANESDASSAFASPSLRGSYGTPPSSYVRDTIVSSLPQLHQQKSAGLRSNNRYVVNPPSAAPPIPPVHHAVGGPVHLIHSTNILKEIHTSSTSYVDDTPPPPTPSIAHIPVHGPVHIIHTTTDTVIEKPISEGPDNRLLSVDCGSCYPVIDIDGDNAVIFIKNVQIQFLSFSNEAEKFEPTTTLKVDYDASSVSISANTTVIGTEGKVYIFEKDMSSDTWEQTTELSLVDVEHFGSDVSIDGNVLVVGATGDAIDDSGTGAAYVYRRSQDGWVQEAKLVATDRKAPYEVFGHVVSVKGNIIVTGDEYFDKTNNLHRAVHVYQYDSLTGWSLVGDSIKNDECESGFFGTAVGITEDGNVLISCHRDHKKAGAVFYYTRSSSEYGSEYVMKQKIVSSAGSTGDEFGGLFKTIAVDGNIMSIGTGKTNRVYTFTLQDNLWTETSQIDPPAGFNIVQHGSNIALCGNRLIARSSSNAYSYKLSSRGRDEQF